MVRNHPRLRTVPGPSLSGFESTELLQVARPSGPVRWFTLQGRSLLILEKAHHDEKYGWKIPAIRPSSSLQSFALGDTHPRYMEFSSIVIQSRLQDPQQFRASELTAVG